jgi:hypothetical protein
MGKAAVGALVLGILLLATGYAVLRGYLHSDRFRKFLSAEAGKLAGVTGEFAPFRWQGLVVETDSYTASGEGLVTAVRADGLHTEMGLGGIRRGVWEVRDSRVRRLELSLDARKRVDDEAIAKEERKSDQTSGWLPRDAELLGMEVGALAVRAVTEGGLLDASGMAFTARQAGARNAYRAEISGGVVKFPQAFVPELRIDRVKARYQEGTVYLTDARFDAWEDGSVTAVGECDIRAKRMSVEGKATGIRTENVFGPDWAKRLTGEVVSDFSVESGPAGAVASGGLTISNGVLTALPLLDALAAYADTRRFRVLTLNEARTDWRWEKDTLYLTNLRLGSEGLVRLEGSLTLASGAVDGVFRLGLAPGTLARIPGAETNVFLPGERGLLWAPLRVTGTLEDPEEDLTGRLMAAAGMRMFELIPETGGKAIRFSRTVLEKAPEKSVETGVKIIGEGTKIVREAGGLLEGLLGGERKKEEP